MTAQSSSKEDQSHHYEGTNRLLIGMCLAVLVIWLFGLGSAGALLPAVSQDLNVSEGDLSTPFSLTGLFSGVLIVAAGRFADNFGRKRLTIIGLALNIVGSVLPVVFPSLLAFSAGKALQGVAGACIMPATLSLVKNYYHDKRQHSAVSAWSMSSWGGSAGAPIVVGAIATYIGWQYSFVLSAVVSVIAFVLISNAPESKAKDSSKGMDFLGIFLLITGLLAVNLLVTNASSWGVANFLTWALVVYAVISFVVLIHTESKKGKRAIVDLSVFKSNKFNTTTLSNLLMNLSGGAVVYIYVSFVQNVFGLDALHAGLLTIGYLITVLIAIPLGEKVMTKFQPKRPMLIGVILVCVSFGMVALTFLPQTVYYVVSVIALSLMGFGLGIYATPSTDTALSELSYEDSATGSGIYKMASSLGGSFGVALGGVIYATSQDATSASITFLVMLGFAVLTLITVLRFRNDSPHLTNNQDKKQDRRVNT